MEDLLETLESQEDLVEETENDDTDGESAGSDGQGDEETKQEETETSEEEDKAEDKGDEADTEGGEAAEKETEKKADDLKDFNDPGELRQMLRESRRREALMTEKLDRLEKTIQKKGKEEDFDFEEPEDKKEELGELEQIEQGLNQINQTNGKSLDILYETMVESDRYPDLEQACSQKVFEDMFEMMGNAIARDRGIDPHLATMRTKISVWSMANPYKFMYNAVKQYHPDFKDKEEKKAEEKPAKPEPKTAKETPKVPTSIASMGGSDTKDTGWTAKKIDAIPDDELSDADIPEPVYEAYLRGELK
jgi:hypothetical protein